MLKKIIALLLAAVLLLGVSACKKSTTPKEMEPLLETAEVAMQEGRFFFVGKVHAVSAVDKMITYYEAKSEKNTFYQVEVTDDLFGCMPQTIITLCVYGTGREFQDRKTLEKGKEYFFDARLWVDEKGPVYLLPTFYNALPQVQGKNLILEETDQTYALGTAADYRKALLLLANRVYGAQTVAESMKSQMELAIKNSNQAFFEKAGIKDTDPAFLKQVTDSAQKLLNEINRADPTWKGVKEILQ